MIKRDSNTEAQQFPESHQRKISAVAHLEEEQEKNDLARGQVQDQKVNSLYFTEKGSDNKGSGNALISPRSFIRKDISERDE